MSQSALLGLSGSVLPQTALASLVGPRGNALLSNGVQGNGESAFSTLLGGVSTSPALALQELSAAATSTNKVAGSAIGSSPELKTEIVSHEKGENAIVGLAAILPIDVVSALSTATVALETGLANVVADQSLTGNVVPDAVLQGLVMGKANQSFVPVPTVIPSQSATVPAPVLPAGPLPGSDASGKSAGQVNERPVLKTALNSNAPADPVRVDNTQSSALLRDAGEIESGQELPQAQQKHGAEVFVGLNSAGEEMDIALPPVIDIAVPPVSGKEIDGAVRVAQSNDIVKLDNEPVEITLRDLVTAPVGALRGEQFETSGVSLKPNSNAQTVPQLWQDAEPSTKSVADVPLNLQSAEVPVLKAETNTSAPAVLGAPAVNRPSVEPIPVTQAAVEATPVVGGQKQLSELAKAPDVQSITVEVGASKRDTVVATPLPQASLSAVADPAVVKVPRDVTEPSEQTEQPVLRRSVRQRVDFVGSQASVKQNAVLKAEPQLLFPNVTLKAPDTLDPQLIKNTGASQVTPVITGNPVAVSNVAADVVVRTSAPTVVAPKVRELAKVTQHPSGVSAVADGSSASAGGSGEVEQSAVKQAIERSAVETQAKTETSVTVQVNVPSAPEQAKTETAIGWGTAFGGLATSEMGVDWEDADFATSITGRSDFAAKPVASLPTSMLRNVASSVWPEIVRQATGGATRFEIRLDPKELGGVDVSLEFGKDGRVRAHLIVERPETLELLQRDQRGLEKALQDAGVESDKSSLQFSLRREGGGSQNQFEEHRDNQQEAFADPESASGEAALAELNAAAQQNFNRSSSASGLDISV